MKPEFDFKTVGKNMPYSTPEGFFDEAEREARAAARISVSRAHGSGKIYLCLAYAALVSVAIVSAFWLKFAQREVSVHQTSESEVAYNEYCAKLQDVDSDELEYLALAYADNFDVLDEYYMYYRDF